MSTTNVDVNQQAADVWNSLPEGLRTALQIWSDERLAFASAPATPALRELITIAATGRPFTKEVISEVLIDVEEWALTQPGRYDAALEMRARLEVTEPLDPAAMPEWPYTKWGRVLAEPWASETAWAIEAAEEHLAK